MAPLNFISLFIVIPKYLILNDVCDENIRALKKSFSFLDSFLWCVPLHQTSTYEEFTQTDSCELALYFLAKRYGVRWWAYVAREIFGICFDLAGCYVYHQHEANAKWTNERKIWAKNKKQNIKKIKMFYFFMGV